jgi:hypothetical protein
MRAEREASLAVRALPDGRTWLAVAELAARLVGAELGEVLEGQRSPTNVRARVHAWVVLLEAGYSYPDIARGWRIDHSTIVSLVQKYFPAAAGARRDEWLRANPGIAKARAVRARRVPPAAKPKPGVKAARRRSP